MDAASDDRNDGPEFVGKMSAPPGSVRLALWVVAILSLAFFAAAPFARLRLWPVPAFIPTYEIALLVNDLVTASLLLNQQMIMRSRALLLLGAAYVFSALMAGAHVLTYPGVYASNGLIGAGAQTAAWIYLMWHAGFPLLVMVYAVVKTRPDDTSLTAGAGPALAGAVAGAAAAAAAVALATLRESWLPRIMDGNSYTPVFTAFAALVWVVTVGALAAMWRSRPHSLIDLWLMVVLFAWLADVALSAVLNAERFDLGYYAGRIYGVLAASFVLLLLLRAHGKLYLELFDIHERERGTSRELRRLNELSEARGRELHGALLSLQLKESELNAVLANLADGVVTFDHQGTVRSANQAVERIFGYRADELIGSSVAILVSEPYRMLLDGYLDEYRETGVAREIDRGREIEGVHRSGERIAIELAIGEYRVGEQGFFAGTLRDIRERKRIIADLTGARAEAEHANQAKANFLAAMSHEIRTPLNGVVGMVDVLQQSSLKGHQMEMVELIRESAYSLLGIIEDILDFSKIEAGRLEIESATLSVEAVVEKVCGMLRHQAGRGAIELTMFIDPRIPVECKGDPLRLKQILINLTNNAIKFSSGQQRSGRVALRALLRSRGSDRIEVEFNISDNGIGMSDDVVERLFSPFTQADASTTRRFGGTGLGLAISRQLAELMGGALSVRSEPEVGSTFTLCLPLVPVVTATSSPSPESIAVNGLRCVVVGGGMADDWAVYLAHDNASVVRAADLAAGRIASANPPGLTVWIIDAAADEPPSIDALQAAAPAGKGHDTRFVVIRRGRRVHPRFVTDRLVTVDGDALSRRALLLAVAMAAGRIQEQEQRPTGRHEADFTPVSRAEALRLGRLILVAEDNEANRKVISRQFALLGYAADIVEDGRQALERWRSEEYALVLTDLHMPELDGYQLAAAIRAEERDGRRTPIVALTANALRGEGERCLAWGMDDYLTKPAPLDDLKAKLGAWIEPVRGSGKTPEPRPNDGAAFDLGVLEGLIGDDPRVVREFIQDYRALARKLGPKIRAACMAGQAAEAAAVAHRFKSSACAIGAFRLAGICEEIEDAGKALQSDALAALLPRFEAELGIVDAGLAAGPAIDMAALARILGSASPQTAAAALADFAEAARISLAEVAAAAGRGRIDAMIAAAHGAEGEAESGGAVGLAALYAELAANFDDQARRAAIIVEIHAELNRVEEFIQGLATDDGGLA